MRRIDSRTRRLVRAMKDGAMRSPHRHSAALSGALDEIETLVCLGPEGLARHPATPPPLPPPSGVPSREATKAAAAAVLDQFGEIIGISHVECIWRALASAADAPAQAEAWRPITEAGEVRDAGAWVDLWGHLARDQFKPCVKPRRITDCRFRLNGRAPDSVWGWFTKDDDLVVPTHFVLPPVPPQAQEVTP